VREKASITIKANYEDCHVAPGSLHPEGGRSLQRLIRLFAHTHQTPNELYHTLTPTLRTLQAITHSTLHHTEHQTHSYTHSRRLLEHSHCRATHSTLHHIEDLVTGRTQTLTTCRMSMYHTALFPPTPTFTPWASLILSLHLRLPPLPLSLSHCPLLFADFRSGCTGSTNPPPVPPSSTPLHPSKTLLVPNPPSYAPR